MLKLKVKTLPGLGLLIAITLLFAPIVNALEDKPPADDTVISGDVKLRYTDIGSGTPVILLHGFGGDYQHSMQWTGAALSEDYRIIGLDQRGHGRSDKPHDEAAYGRHFAEDVLLLMDELGVEKAHLVGHSMGGIVVMYLAANHPGRLYSAVTIGNGLFKESELTLIGWLIRGKYAWAELKSFLGVGDSGRKPGNDNKALLIVARHLGELVVSESQAAEIAVPLLAVRGGPKDDPNDTVERLVAINPAVEMIRIESEDHVSVIQSEVYLDGLAEFILAHQPPQ